MSTAAIFLWLGWTLAAVATLLVAWALLWDCARGRRRCPRCWYDLVGAASLPTTCAECGRAILRERALRRTRRRWRWAILGITLLLGSWFVAHTPVMRERGWVAAIPTEALVRWAPVPEMGWESPAPNPLRDELDARLRGFDTEPLNPRQWWVLMCRYGKAHPTRASTFARTRSVWPEGVTPRVEFRPPGWLQYRESLDLALRNQANGETIATETHYGFGLIVDPILHYYIDGTRELRDVDAPHADLEVEIIERPDTGTGWRRTWPSTQRLEWEQTASVDDLLTGVPSEAVADAMRNEILVSLRTSGHGASRVTLWGLDRVGDTLRAAGDPTLAGRITILRDEVEMGSAEVWWTSRHSYTFDSGNTIYWSLDRFLISIGGDRAFDSTGSNTPQWSVRFTADPALALRDFETSTYWSGEVTLPVAHVDHDPALGTHWTSEAAQSHPRFQDFLRDLNIPAPAGSK